MFSKNNKGLSLGKTIVKYDKNVENVPHQWSVDSGGVMSQRDATDPVVWRSGCF